MEPKFYSIAIDGPAGAGKSTLAKALAARLGFLYVDTGAIYRTVGLFVARSGGDCGDKAQVLIRLPEIRIAMTYGEDGLQHMLLNGEDVTKAIRENAVSGYASLVSAYPEVRAFLLDMQRALARTHNVIMDGRDIGTVVLPGADVKVFLTASPEERAKRRCRELEEKGCVIELRAYHTKCGIWKYFTADDGQIDLKNHDYLGIGTLESYQKMREYFGEERIVPLYIEVEDGERLMRALTRERMQKEPKYAEMCRRFLADTEDFSEENLKAVGITERFENRELEETVRKISERIQQKTGELG